MTIARIVITPIITLMMVLFSALPASAMKVVEVMSDKVSVEFQKGDTVGAACFAILPLPTKHVVYGPGGCVQSVAKYRNPHVVKAGETVSIPFRLAKPPLLLAAANKPVRLPEKVLAPAQPPKVTEPADKQVVLVGSDEGRRVPNSKPLTIPSDPLAESRRELQTLVGDLRVNTQELEAELVRIRQSLANVEVAKAQSDDQLMTVQKRNNELVTQVRDLGASIAALRVRVAESNKALKAESGYKGQYVFWKLLTWATIAVAVVGLCALAFLWYREDLRLNGKLKTAQVDRKTAHDNHVRVEGEREKLQEERDGLAAQLEAANATAAAAEAELAAQIEKAEARYRYLPHQVGDRIPFSTGNDGEIVAVVGRVTNTQSLKGKRGQEVLFHALDDSGAWIRWEEMADHIKTVFAQEVKVDNGVGDDQPKGEVLKLAEVTA